MRCQRLLTLGVPVFLFFFATDSPAQTLPASCMVNVYALFYWQYFGPPPGQVCWDDAIETQNFGIVNCGTPSSSCLP